MKCGIVKQKWTPEEEAALRAGVEKYGAGKWRAIQKDPDFSACLVSRSNVDLKDKWRNMSVSANGLGSREKATRMLAAKIRQVGDLKSDTKAVKVSMINASKDKRLVGTRLDQYIMDAATSLKDSNGGTKEQIASYLKDHYPVPPNFKRLLATKLKFLTQEGKLTKIRRNYIAAQDTLSADETSGGKPMEQEAKKGCTDREDNARATLNINGMATDEAIRAAVQAVVNAEAAAAAAEEAAQVAEIAEAEWEAAEAAAEMAVALASGSVRNR